MAYGRTLHEIMSERPARPIRKARTLAEIMSDRQPADRDDEDGTIPTDESGLRLAIAEYDAERERVKDELTRQKMAAVRPGEADLARASERDLFRRMGHIEVVRSELAGRLQRLLQTQAAESMHAGDGDASEAAGELQKLYARRAAIIEKREAVSDQERRDLGREIDRLEDIIRR